MTSKQQTGLTSAEVAERIAKGESNAIKPYTERTYWQIIRDNIFTLFNLALLALMVVLLVFRDYGSIIFASFSVIANSLIGTIQELSAKRSLDRLAALASHDVTVWRDGVRQNILIADVVKDDVLPIEPGDRLVVDGTVLSSDSLEMDESLLTGESDVVLKDDSAPVYSGSYCVAGSGIMVATLVGVASTVNKVASTAKSYRNVKTPTQIKVDIFVELAVIAILIFGPMVIVTGVINKLVPLETVRNALVLVTSLVPQGLVLSTTLALTLGAVHISRHQTLIKRINAVESLANITVLCFDKTGTLTRNELTVVDLLPFDGQRSENVRSQLVFYMHNLSHLNKTAAAIANYCKEAVITNNSDSGLAITNKLDEIPFSSVRKWGAVVLSDRTLILGAPERVLNQETNQAELERAQQLASNGMRVLAFAQSEHPPENNTLDPASRPLALIVLSDKVRNGIQETLSQFIEQHVALKVISGDNQETIAAIATQAGIKVTGIFSGEQLKAMSAIEFDSAVTQANLFARIEPDTKRKIIAALKHQGAYVAMVGDGVNDVPALKEAHLAIVMNDGAQIARDIADIVLLNNDVSTLPIALAEGKMITQKIYATARIFLSKNVYHLMLFVLVSFMSLPFPISPIQISWFALIVVNVPSTLIAFGVIKPAFVKRFNRDVLGYVVISGLVGALGMALFYTIIYLTHNRDIATARSGVLLFMTLFGVLVFLNTQEISLFRPKTILDHWPSALLGVVLATGTIILPFIAPSTFRFVLPTEEVWLLLVVVFGITATALNIALHHLDFLDRLKQLMSA